MKLYISLFVTFLCIAFISFANEPTTIWAKTFGGPDNESGQISSLDNNGNIFVAGTSLSSTFALGATNIVNNRTSHVTSYVAKYSPSGNLLWARGGGTGNSYTIRAITNDNSGNTYISGTFHSPTLRFGNITLSNSNPYYYGKVFIAKYSPTGDIVWAITPNIEISSGTTALAFDKTGFIYITGMFQDRQMAFGDVSISNPNSERMQVFLFKLNLEGKAIWGRSFGGNADDVGGALTVENDGSIIMSGEFRSPNINFDNISLQNSDNSFNNIFLTKLSSSGQVLWAKNIGANGNDVCKSIATDLYGNIYCGGFFTGPTLNVGAGLSINNNNNGSSKSFLVKYNPQGNALWLKSSGSGGFNAINAICIDKHNNVYASGFFEGNIRFENISLTNKLSRGIDIVILKYNSAGTIEWAKNYGDVEKTHANTCLIDNNGDLYITGEFGSQAIYFDNFKVYNHTFYTQEQTPTADVLLIKLKQPIDSIKVMYCTANNTAILSIAEPAKFYEWMNSSGQSIGDKSELIVNNPLIGDTYSCRLTFENGSSMILNTTIIEYKLITDFNFSITDCKTNNIQFSESVISSHFPTQIKWDFGDGTNSTLSNPSHKFNNAGKYKVSLEITNPLSACAEIIEKEVEVFAPMAIEIIGDSVCCHGGTLIMRAMGAPQFLWSNGSTADSIIVNDKSGTIWVVGIYGDNKCQSDTAYKSIVGGKVEITITGNHTYCPNETTTIVAHGANNYIWSTGEASNSIDIGSTSNKFWVVGFNTNGCISDTLHFSISEEPDWDFNIAGNLHLCKGDSTLLTLNGAHSNIWNNGDTKNAIYIKSAGTFSVVAMNERGCKKLNFFSIEEFSIPEAFFTVSANQIDSRNNQIEVNAEYNPKLQYIFDMGDGTIKHDAKNVHTYHIDNSQAEFRIKLTTINENGCQNEYVESIDVIPFIPNVFTPNSDGINDIFAPNLDLLIIDRFGKNIYQGKNGWDGNYKGTKAPSDTYFYIVKYSDKHGNIQSKKGVVTLIR